MVENARFGTMPQHPRVDPGTFLLAAAWQWTPAGVATLAATLVFVVLAAYVWRRRSGSAGAALALVLVAVLLWAGAYAAELGATGLSAKRTWGDFKYVGICLLPPAWLRSRRCSPGAASGSTAAPWRCWRSSRCWCWRCWPTPPPTT
jgi:hypothetical protein